MRRVWGARRPRGSSLVPVHLHVDDDVGLAEASSTKAVIDRFVVLSLRLVKRWIFSASAPKISANFALMPPKESLFSTLKKTVVFFRLTRTYLRDALASSRRKPRARRRFAAAAPTRWCLCYLDTARHICGDAIKAARLYDL